MIGWVLVGDGGPGEKVEEGGGGSSVVAEVCVLMISPGVTVKSRAGGEMINGVAVTMEGVLEGTGDKTGKGCGAIPQISQEVRRNAHAASAIAFLIRRL